MQRLREGKNSKKRAGKWSMLSFKLHSLEVNILVSVNLPKMALTQIKTVRREHESDVEVFFVQRTRKEKQFSSGYWLMKKISISDSTVGRITIAPEN